jgi:K(+)-stimulated pyrophosphate-energized sodium pump
LPTRRARHVTEPAVVPARSTVWQHHFTNLTWFSFDRIEFDTASATLRPSSNDQLDAIAAILKAYPHVELKIGGYTANVGDDAENLKLSAARAQHTMQALIARGVAAGRLSSEGFGEQHPVASNDTEDGRQRNRRIDVRVTRK